MAKPIASISVADVPTFLALIAPVHISGGYVHAFLQIGPTRQLALIANSNIPDKFLVYNDTGEMLIEDLP